MKAIKICSLGAAIAILVFVVSGYFYLVYKNNLDTPEPTAQEIQQALDRSISWLLNNRDEVIQQNNPVLWWFLDESALLTDNGALASLALEYRRTIFIRHINIFANKLIYIYYHYCPVNY